MDDRSSTPLARLAAMASRMLVEDVQAQLAKRGFRDVGVSFGYVVLEARQRRLGVSDVARLLDVSKQAASKLVSVMQQCGYLNAVTTADQRERRVEISARGRRLADNVEAVYRELDARWAEVIGDKGVEAIRRDLAAVLAARGERS